MKYEIPNNESLTIKCYKVSYLRKKIKVYYVNKSMKKPIVIPYSRLALNHLKSCMESQLDEYVSKTDIVTQSNNRYFIYSRNRSEFTVTDEEKRLFNLKDMEVNANTVDKYSCSKLESRLELLRKYRRALSYMLDNNIYSSEGFQKTK